MTREVDEMFKRLAVGRRVPRQARGAMLALAVICMIAAPATTSASTTYAVTAHFTETIAPSIHHVDCPVSPEGFCGSGRVLPFGRATETIEFGAGCGGGCDLRTVSLSQGTLTFDETFSDFACPGACRSNAGMPVSGSLTDVVIGGTGAFAGATGTLTGSVKASGGEGIPVGESQVHLNGSINLGS
jgi:hypothetical protein